MRHLTLLALVGLLLGTLAFWTLNAEAHHVGGADILEIGPCPDGTVPEDLYDYIREPTLDEIAYNILWTACWPVHGGVDDVTGVYPEPGSSMGPQSPTEGTE